MILLLYNKFHFKFEVVLVELDVLNLIKMVRSVLEMIVLKKLFEN